LDESWTKDLRTRHAPQRRHFIQPYLFFNGRCDEALEFYRSAIGVEVLVLMRFKDSPGPPPPGMLAPGF